MAKNVSTHFFIEQNLSDVYIFACHVTEIAMSTHGHCFMEGSHIRTSEGDRPVESIKPGDLVVAVRAGQEVLEPVRWVGYTTIDLARIRHVEDLAPVRIRAGALAEAQPVRDLILSPEHCLIIDGFCIPVKLLVNGGSIVSERDHPPFMYYHLELDRHAILLAENAPAESYLETGGRPSFDNYDGPAHLHKQFKINLDSSRWQTDACAPLARIPDDIDPIWTRLAERSVAIGYPIPAVETTPEAGLHLVADGKVIRPISDNETHYVFLVPAGVSSVTLKSQFCIPSDRMISNLRDTRRLGVRVSWLAIKSAAGETMLAADHPALETGWNDVERDGTIMWRWTDGAATIPWDGVEGSAVLTVRCTMVDAYPLYDEKARLVA